MSLNALAAADSAAAPAAKKSGSSWGGMAGWPDLMTGMWAEHFEIKSMGKPPLTPEAQARLAALPKNEGNGASCKPLGMPDMMSPGYPWAFFYSKGSLFVMSDMDDLLVRHVFLDRAEHGDPDPSRNGHSIGHWEGKTLVIDTIGINAQAPLAGLPSGGKTHVVEHIRLTAPNKMEWKISITNPDILAQPWEFTKTFERHSDWELQEASCVEGNRDTPDASGNPHVDLTPPK